MPKFVYEASDENGIIKTGEFDASEKADVVTHLEGRKLIPVSIREFGEHKEGGVLSQSLFEKMTPLDRIMIVRNLSAAIKAGLSVIEALDIMIADAQKKIVKNILIDTKANLENGQPLWRTFESYKNSFPIIFVGMVKAGEASGELDKALDELSEHLIREHSLTGKVKSAMTYPVILLSAAFAIVTLLLVFVLPRISKVFQTSGMELPLITKLLIGLSNAIVSHVFIDIAVVVMFLGFVFYLRRTPTGVRLMGQFILKVPVVKELVKKVALVRFTRTLSSLIKSGTPMLEALSLSADSVSNETYKRVVVDSIQRVKSGIPLSDSLRAYPKLFPHFLVGLMAVGEKTGTLDRTLRTFSDFYDEEIDNTLKTLVSLLEPILIIFMGLIVVLIAVSVLLPIYRLSSGFL